MDATGKELDANRAILHLGIQDADQWAQNVEGYMRGLPKPGSMSEVEKNINAYGVVQKSISVADVCHSDVCWSLMHNIPTPPPHIFMFQHKRRKPSSSALFATRRLHIG